MNKSNVSFCLSDHVPQPTRLPAAETKPKFKSAPAATSKWQTQGQANVSVCFLVFPRFLTCVSLRSAKMNGWVALAGCATGSASALFSSVRFEFRYDQTRQGRGEPALADRYQACRLYESVHLTTSNRPLVCRVHASPDFRECS